MYLMQPMLRHRLAIITTADNLAETPLHAFLSTILGRSDFVTSLRLAPGRPNSKPVVQAVAHDGSVLGYAKFGWEKLTCRLMRHEAVVLRDLRLLTQGSAFRVPEVIHAGEWQGLETVVLAPLDCKGRTPRAFADLPVAASVCSPDSVRRLSSDLATAPSGGEPRRASTNWLHSCQIRSANLYWKSKIALKLAGAV